MRLKTVVCLKNVLEFAKHSTTENCRFTIHSINMVHLLDIHSPASHLAHNESA